MARLDSQDFCLSLSDLARFLNETPAETKDLVKKRTGRPLNSLHINPVIVRQLLESRGLKYMNRVVSMQMLKGGVAKTTSVLNIGIRAAMYGAKVLFIDLDQQANLSFALGVEDEDRPVWVDLVERKATIQDLIVEVGSHLHLIPSNLNNSVLDRVLLNSNRNWAYTVKAPLEAIRQDYDLILIDTAPALSATNTAATVASDEVILPVNPDKFSFLGLKKHLAELAALRTDFGLTFIEKILFTRYDGCEKTSRELLQSCVEDFADRLMKSYIRSSTDVKNSIRGEKHLFAGSSPVKDDYDLITREVLNFPLG
jgi:chromosome partitioning protein